MMSTMDTCASRELSYYANGEQHIEGKVLELQGPLDFGEQGVAWARRGAFTNQIEGECLG